MWCSYFFQLLERISDTSNAKSGSDVDDLGSLIAPKDVEYHSLAPVREEVDYFSLNYFSKFQSCCRLLTTSYIFQKLNIFPFYFSCTNLNV